MSVTRTSIQTWRALALAAASAAVVALAIWWTRGETEAVAAVRDDFEAAAPAQNAERVAALELDAPAMRAPTPVADATAPVARAKRRERFAVARTISGRVTCIDCDNLAARFGLFEYDAAAPNDDLLERGHAREDGSFEIQVDRPGKFALLAFAPGRRPGTAVVTIDEKGGDVALAPILLERGLSISGFVRGVATRAGTPMRVRARTHEPRAQQALVYRAFGSRFGWTDGRFEWSVGGADTDANSSYTIWGLRPVEYALSVVDVGELDLDFHDVALVRAPASAVMLNLATCSVQFHFFQQGKPAANQGFVLVTKDELGGSTFQSMATDANGNAEVVLAPHSSVELRCGAVQRQFKSTDGVGELDERIDL